MPRTDLWKNSRNSFPRGVGDAREKLKWTDSLISPEREISQETRGTDIRYYRYYRSNNRDNPNWG